MDLNVVYKREFVKEIKHQFIIRDLNFDLVEKFVQKMSSGFGNYHNKFCYSFASLFLIRETQNKRSEYPLNKIRF